MKSSLSVIWPHARTRQYYNRGAEMQKLKQYAEQGLVEIAKLDDNNKPVQVPFSELQSQVSFQSKNARILQTLAALAPEDRLEWVHLKRLKAKQHYQQGEFDLAMDLYLECLLGVDLANKPPQEQEQLRSSLQHPILLNIMTCLYRKKQFPKAISICDTILKQNSRHIMTIYKKANLLKQMGNLAQSKELLVQGITIAKEDKDEANLLEFTKVYKQLLSLAKKNKSMYQKMFSRGDEPSLQAQYKQQAELLPQSADSEQQLLFYQQQPNNICERVYRKLRGLLGALVPGIGQPQPKFIRLLQELKQT